MTGRPRVVVVQNTERSGPGRLLDWLAEEGIDAVLLPGADLPDHPSAAARPSAAGPPVARSRTRMDLPPGDVDGLVLLGGNLMPDDDERAPFLARERALVREALEDDVPVLGICLGAQLLAHVAGGEVTAKSGETERGSCAIELLPAAADDPLFAGFSGDGELRMFQNHEDSITTLPPDAVHLATSEACRVQAFRIGGVAWGVQFHPEATADKAINTVQARALVGAFADVVRESRR
jgi:GMP synthase-like glutamine amidotransferase